MRSMVYLQQLQQFVHQADVCFQAADGTRLCGAANGQRLLYVSLELFSPQCKD
jgi:hypothetical protein